MPQIRGNAHNGEGEVKFCEKHGHAYRDFCMHCLGEQPVSTFPLSKQEAGLLYDELLHHTFSKDHPYYHYAHSLIERMGRFVGK